MISIVCAEESVTRSNTLTPKDLGIKKWDLTYQTTKEKTFVIRLQHYVNGKLVKDYEDFYYKPKKAKLGSLLVFSRPEFTVYFPSGGRFDLEVCKHGVCNETATELLCVDGVTRKAKTIHIEASDYHENTEELLIHLYAAPMRIFRDNDSKVPKPADNISFYWHREIIPQIIVTTKKVNGKLEVEFFNTAKNKPTKMENKAQ